MIRPAVFLDRDGTIIEDRHFLADPSGVQLLPDAAEALARLHRAGWPLIVVTNQSGIGRGFFTEVQFRAVQERLRELLAAGGVKLTATYHCPHAPDSIPACDCRKPLPGLLHLAARQHGIDLSRSHYIGDRLRDVEAGVKLGGTGYLLRVGAAGEETPRQAGILPVTSLAEVAKRILDGTETTVTAV